MKLINFKQKRVILASFALLMALSLANRYLNWALLGKFDEVAPFLLLLPIFALFWFWADEMHEEGQKRLAARREAEVAAELARDKSHDAEDSDSLRSDIGLPPNTSFERTREE